jgi:N-methylhydantoinase B
MFHQVPLKRGDVARLVTATGGGFGKPDKRDAGRLRDDLKNEFITKDQAREFYNYDPVSDAAE